MNFALIRGRVAFFRDFYRQKLAYMLFDTLVAPTLRRVIPWYSLNAFENADSAFVTVFFADGLLGSLYSVVHRAFLERIYINYSTFGRVCLVKTCN